MLAQAAAIDGQRVAELGRAFDRGEAGTAKGNDDAEAVFFLGYLSGVLDTGGKLKKFCVPDGVTMKQIATIVSRLSNSAPQLWHFPGHYHVEEALSRAFPCPAE